MKRIFFLTLLTAVAFALRAQQRQTLFVQANDLSGKVIQVPEKFSEGPFIAFSMAWQGRAPREWLVTAHLNDGTSETFRLHRDEHNNDPVRLVSELAFLPKETKSVSLAFFPDRNMDSPSENGLPGGLAELHFFNPGHTKKVSSPHRPPNTRMACPCPLPAYQSRSDWCPDGSCPADPTPTFTVVTHLIVHHSAGPNSSGDWPAVVRAIWDYHVNVNGWDDIGYNWLIDPDGNIYQGRGDNVLGAHFCGTNGGTMGVCMMGNYQEADPAQEALSQLEKLLAWKSCDASIDPLATAYHPSSGLNLYRISGHRDGCSTECPGDHLYPLLPQLRQAVHNRIDNLCASVPSAPAAPTQLTATVINPFQVQLSWTDNADNETGFILERSEANNNTYAQLAAMPENTVAFDDLTVLPSTGYYYRVRATGAGVFSDFSNEVFVVTGATAAVEQDLADAVFLFPNPARTEVNLQVAMPGFAEGKVAFYDGLGRQALQLPVVAGENRLNTQSLSPGLYLLKISGKDLYTFRKLMIVR